MPAPDSKQLTIMKRLTAQLQTITPANGYDYDLSASVYRGKGTFGSDDAPPFLNIMETLRPDARPDFGGTEQLIRVERWELFIQGFAVQDDTNPTDNLYQLKAATEFCLSQLVVCTPEGSPVYPAAYRLGRIVNAITIGPGIVRASTPVQGGTTAFYLPLVISYGINMADPYSLAPIT